MQYRYGAAIIRAMVDLHKAPLVALALGTNLGDRVANLQAAVDALAPHIKITAASPVYETPPAYVLNQPAFLNAALIGITDLRPEDLLRTIKDLERKLGRFETFQYGPRMIDIDILFYGEDIIDTPDLTIPHPHMAEREFVLRPLADIASDWTHPQKSLSVKAMLSKLPGRQAVVVTDRIRAA